MAKYEGGRSQNEPSETEQILGRPVEAAKRDIASVVAGKEIDPQWKGQYERLLQIRDHIIDEEQQLEMQGQEIQPDPVMDEGAESATNTFTRDMSLGRVSGYQELLDEVNAALARIEDGSYGICEVTGDKIPTERLKAVPWTRVTREAEEQLEREGRSPLHFELPPQFSTGDVSSGRTEVESTTHREKHQHRF
jgi:RNA polymerase-binding transcription factor DksA